jgi:hypothetical protein
MKIIDFDKKGNVVRFFLGEKTKDWGWVNPNFKRKRNGELVTPDWLKPDTQYYGDDWDDAPYECNAGQVYEHFVKAYMDIAFPYDSIVCEPSDDWKTDNTPYSKEDFVKRKCPCIAVLSSDYADDYAWRDSFSDIIGNDHTLKIYYGDDESVVKGFGTLINYEADEKKLIEKFS